MPWRMIGFIVLFGILLVFITLNLQNSCDVSFGFTIVENVPVYLTAFCAFALGLLFAIPLSISFRRKQKAKQTELSGGRKPNKKQKNEALPGEIPEISPYRDDKTYGID
jgi:uncharacterized integral membrane protein